MKSLVDPMDYMQLAIAEAIKAKNKKEVPVGAVIVNSEGQVIAKAHNLVETKNNLLLYKFCLSFICLMVVNFFGAIFISPIIVFDSIN